tara:strand:- start:39594 stop:40190 length:597 start_codon:yes stop_codon:yes gene_type:complete
MKSKTSTVQQEKLNAKRVAILESALDQITLYGFHGTSIKMIASSANVAAGSIYNHFSNKEEVIQAVYLRLVSEINEVVLNHHDPAVPFEQDFLNIWNAILQLYISDTRKPEFISQFAYSPYILEKSKTSPQILLEPVLEIFNSARQNGLIKNLPNPALLALTHSPISSLVRMAKYEQIDLAELSISNYSQACWDSIKI